MSWITLALSFGTELLKQLPDFDQKKKRDYHKKLEQYQSEKAKSYAERDDDLIMNLRAELHAFLMAFKKEIEK